MARYIDAVKTAEIISEKCGIDISELVDIFAEIPTADVEPVQHGKWIKDDLNFLCCSNCGYSALSEKHMTFVESSYCPSCGTMMDEED